MCVFKIGQADNLALLRLTTAHLLVARHSGFNTVNLKLK